VAPAALRLPPVLQAYDSVLHEHALPTKAATGGVVFALASRSSQAIRRSADGTDLMDVARMAAFGCLLDAPLQHAWHNTLEALLPGAAPSVVAEKILVDQLLMAPCQLSVYLTATALLAGGRFADGVGRIHDEFFGVFRVHAAFWCVAHAVTFGLMPLEYRVPWCTVCNLGYVTALAYLTQSQQPPASEDSSVASQSL
jgi:protein Mpv17